MSLRDELASFKAYRGEKCTLKTRLLDTIEDAAYRAEIEAELASPAWTHADWERWWSAKTANAEDSHVSAETFARHRRGRCACGRR